MSPFIETIRLQEGELRNLSYHQARFERTRSRELGLSDHPLLEEFIQVPEGLDQGRFKVRVVYETEIERIEYEPYIWRPVSTLKLVRSDTIDYASKYADRSELERLFAQRGTCDDILISKQGFVSDTFYANSAFWDGQNWYTPDTPLLAGTMRAFLLDQGQLREARIRQADLGKYMKIRLINAMNTLQEGAEIPMDRVII